MSLEILLFGGYFFFKINYKHGACAPVSKLTARNGNVQCRLGMCGTEYYTSVVFNFGFPNKRLKCGA